jgi:large subunit ribosomal protein L31
MKEKIHPNYIEELKITCSCGNVILAGSTKKELRTEICSACHPFYTGQTRLIDTAGRVDKFLAKVKKAQKIKEKQEEVVDEELDSMFLPEEKTETTKKESAKKEVKAETKPAKVKAAKPTAAKEPAAKKSPLKAAKDAK